MPGGRDHGDSGASSRARTTVIKNANMIAGRGELVFR
jgi:hypothetical protein